MENNIGEFIGLLYNKNLSDRTIVEYGRYYDLFPHEIEPLQDAVTRFISHSNNRVARAFVKSYLEFLGRTDIKLPQLSGRKKKKIITPLTETQVNTLRAFLYNDKTMYGVMFDLQLAGGLRREELIKVRVEDFINLDEWLENQTEPCKLKVYGKGNRERIVLISPKVMQKVVAWIEYVMKVENSQKLFNISVWSYWKHIHRIGKKTIGIRIYPHLIRHTKASMLKKDGFDLLDIKNFLGHSDISTTQLYIHESEEETLDKFRKYIKKKEGV